MGTQFDHFGPEAASLFYEQIGRDPEVRDNRRLLREAMLEEDFRYNDNEWWRNLIQTRGLLIKRCCFVKKNIIIWRFTIKVPHLGTNLYLRKKL